MTANQGPTRRQWALALLAGTAAAAAGAGAWWARRPAPEPVPGAMPGAPGTSAGNVSREGPLSQPLQALGGRTITPADAAGRFVLLNFWAPWCPPCLKEMPEIDRFVRSGPGSQALVVGLAVDEQANVERYLAEHPVGFPIVVVGYTGLAWARRLGNDASALPFSAVYDRSHRLIQRKLGPTTAAELAGWIGQG